MTNDEADNSTAAVMTVHTLQIGSADDHLDRTLKSFWELKSFGVKPTENKTYDHPIHTVELKEGRYEVSLPWKEFHQPLPDNYELSLRRLKSLLQRLQCDPNILDEYSTIIRDQLNAGIIEVVKQTDDWKNTLSATPCRSAAGQGHNQSKGCV